MAKRLAEDNNLDLRLVSGSGPAGRVTKDDVTAYLERGQPAPADGPDRQAAEHREDRAVEYDARPAAPAAAAPPPPRLRRAPAAPTLLRPSPPVAPKSGCR